MCVEETERERKNRTRETKPHTQIVIFESWLTRDDVSDVTYEILTITKRRKMKIEE